MSKPGSQMRCAIYTRKSTEEGLEQEFNSLDAQRESCLAYITSQAGLGWKALAKHYDDGGISGGTMDRPALQALLSDIKAGKVDVVVVYKIDRLTRSLMDFAKIVEVFDAQKVSFVSVTQQFNTLSSMGRLTLNVLLSFAQFEREVTAERIRDKIAASKKKGMWMGGAVPLGYEARDKKLVIVPAAAESVRVIFRRYLEFGSVRKLKEELNAQASVLCESTHRPRTYSRGRLYWLLSNPIYAGDIRHKDQVMPGQHEGIIDRPLWEAVQQKLKGQSQPRGTAENATCSSLLTGLVFDETGDRLVPTHAIKDGKRYRYYISQRLMQKRRKDPSGWRVPAQELESRVITMVGELLKDQLCLHEFANLQGGDAASLSAGNGQAEELSRSLADKASPETHATLRSLTERVDIGLGELRLTISRAGLRRSLGLNDGGAELTYSITSEPKNPAITVPLEIRRRGAETRLIIGGVQRQPANVDQGLVNAVAKARQWLHHLTSEAHPSIASLARLIGVDGGEISRLLPLAFLAPDIVEAIVQGRQPVDLTARKLTRLKPVPTVWSEQRQTLNFAPA